MTNSKVAVLGAGISGLSIAYALHKQGVDVVVYEKEAQPGGVMQSWRKDGWLVEKGPNTMLVRKPEIWKLLNDLGLTDRICKPGKEAKKRYVVRRQKPVPVPASFGAFFTTNLLSFSAKCRLFKEPFMSASRVDDESIADFIRRRLGSEPLDYAVNPFVSGVYAGDPEELSVKHTFSSLFEMEQTHGSITKGFMKRDKGDRPAKKALLSFDEGQQVLPKTMAESLDNTIRLDTDVQKISRNTDKWELQLRSPQETETRRHSAIISTLPSANLAQVWNDKNTEQSVEALAEIDYAPMSVLALGFKRQQVAHPLDGFGMLVPEVEPFSLLGCLFSSSLFPGRAPKNHVLLTCFLGGVRSPQLAAKSTKSLIKETLPQLKALLGVNGQPVFHHHTYWQKAIPQYKVGYDRYLEAMQQIESSAPGFFLGGNYRGGVSVPNCITNGFEIAEEVAQYV